MTKHLRSSRSRKTLARLVAAIGLVGACTVVDKGEYTFTDDPDATGGGAGDAVTGGNGNGGSTGSGGSAGTSGSAGEGGEGDSGGTGGTGDTGGTSGDAGASGNGGTSGTGGSGDGPCDPNPCEHGECSELGDDDYDCVCEDGWEGTRCSVNIDDCDPNPCNMFVCEDLVNDFKCDCPADLTGKLCDLPRFETVPLTNGVQATVARAVNAEGTIVVGTFLDMSSHWRPFQWTRARGTQPMPVAPLPANANYYLTSVSSDGNTWVGHYEGLTPPAFPFRGNNSGAMALGLPGMNTGGFARGISGNGMRAVGNFQDPTQGVQAVHWPDPMSGAVLFPNPIPNSLYASADAITRDGMVAVGVVKDMTSRPHLAVWLPPPTLPPSPRLIPNAMEAQVNGVSANGQAGVGTYKGTGSSSSGYAFAYDANGPYTIAPPAMGGAVPALSAAWDVSDDGLLVVGEAVAGPPGMEETRAYIWQDARTPEHLAQVMNGYGIRPPTGYRLIRAYGVSANNRVIVGEGLNMNNQPEGFILRLP